jgi:hypothetical protein
MIGAGPLNSTTMLFQDTVIDLGGGTARKEFGLSKVNSTGQVNWAKRYWFEYPSTLPFPTFLSQMAVAPDGRIFIHTGEPSVSGIMCFQSNGSMLWARELLDPDGVGGMRKLVPDGAGGCYFLGGVSSQFQDTSTVSIGHLNGNGDLLWSRKFRSSIPGHLFDPMHMIRTQNGDLLITARRFDPENGTSCVLIRLDGTGNEVWVNTYHSDIDEYLDPSATVERPDGRLWLEVDRGGYGLVGLDAQGEVQEAERFTYRSVGNSTHVVELYDLLVHGNDLSIRSTYYIDQSWTGYDPRTHLLFKLNANDPQFCGTDPFVVTRVPGSPLSVEQSITVSVFTVTELPLTLNVFSGSTPAFTSFCSMYVGLEQHEPMPTLSITPGLIGQGSEFVVLSGEPGQLIMMDTNGRLVLDGVNVFPETPVRIPTIGHAPGLYLVRTISHDGHTTRTGRIMIQ